MGRNTMDPKGSGGDGGSPVREKTRGGNFPTSTRGRIPGLRQINMNGVSFRGENEKDVKRDKLMKVAGRAGTKTNSQMEAASQKGKRERARGSPRLGGRKAARGRIKGKTLLG